MQAYTKDFYLDHREGALRSARVVVPLVLELIKPKHVLDVGCGIGTWLSIFKEYGIEDVFGVDGEDLNAEMLLIPREQFLSADLRIPLYVNRQFDLVMSLEVAEHLPRECAEVFVDSLTRHGQVVLFSAATPFQGGANHINEQWPEYWAQYFHERGFVAVDCIRPFVWNNKRVDWWYAQNLLLFAKRDYLENESILKKEYETRGKSQLSVVHPMNHVLRRLACNYRDVPHKRVLKELPTLMKSTLIGKVKTFPQRRSQC